MLALALALFASTALAQPPTFDQLAARPVPGGIAILRTHIDMGARRTEVALRFVRGETRAEPLVLHEGAMMSTAIATREDVVLVAMASPGPEPRVKLAFVREGAPRIVDVARPASVPDGYTPATMLATATPDGFTVLWQEQDASAQNAYTVLARYAPDGREIQPPTPVEIPWAMGAIAWNGHGYHLALLFGGDGRPGQARICLVTLTPAGAPEQHPWWATAPSIINEMDLVREGDAIDLVFRDGEAALVHRSAEIGQWGTEPPASRRVARIRRGQTLLATVREGALSVAGVAWE